MIRLGVPNNMERYFPVDDMEMATELHKAGFIPEYKDEDGVLYFKKSKKFITFIESHKEA